ncbi:alpha/beta hydrolase family protein [Streptosporangium sp. NPDC000095]|uniref:alpha/beta hydrolase family protein n=1 Tax=Streptosporangium sp. NPDC000095 TaxID=3366184 RepID=UPI003693D6FF
MALERAGDERDESEAAIQRPLFLIHGGEDRVTPLGQARTLNRRLGSSSCLVVVAGAGHSLRRADDIHQVLRMELEHVRSAENAHWPAVVEGV